MSATTERSWGALLLCCLIPAGCLAPESGDNPHLVRLHVSVVDASGAPIGDARVRVFPERVEWNPLVELFAAEAGIPFYSVTTHRSGVLEVELPVFDSLSAAPRYQLRVDHPDYCVRSLRDVPVDRFGTGVRVTLAAGCRVRGTVTFDGVPAAGASVSIRQVENPSRSVSCHADDAGRFLAPHCLPSGEYVVRALRSRGLILTSIFGTHRLRIRPGQAHATLELEAW